jgi:hypothetical protein
MPNGDSNISNDLIEAIADSTAISVGEQPAILANLALANLIANTNLAQQNAISNQQAMFQLEMTIVSKCVEVIANINPSSAHAANQMTAMQQLIAMVKQMQADSAVNTRTAQKAAAAERVAAEGDADAEGAANRVRPPRSRSRTTKKKRSDK